MRHRSRQLGAPVQGGRAAPPFLGLRQRLAEGMSVGALWTKYTHTYIYNIYTRILKRRQSLKLPNAAALNVATISSAIDATNPRPLPEKKTTPTTLSYYILSCFGALEVLNIIQKNKNPTNRHESNPHGQTRVGELNP